MGHSSLGITERKWQNRQLNFQLHDQEHSMFDSLHFLGAQSQGGKMHMNSVRNMQAVEFRGLKVRLGDLSPKERKLYNDQLSCKNIVKGLRGLCDMDKVPEPF